MRTCPTLFPCLDAPERRIASKVSPGGLSSRLRINAPPPQPFRKRLSPAVQVSLSRVESLAVLRFRPDADVHMRVGLVIVQHHDVLVIGELLPCELTRGAMQDQRVNSSRHRQHHVVGLTPVTGVFNQGTAEAPVLGKFRHPLSSPTVLPALVLDL